MALSARGLFLSRLMPVLLILTTTYIIPWAKRTYLIFGFSGKNFEQTDMTNWDIIYPDKLIGCEDLHVYNADSGPMIFTGCVEKLEHQLVCSRFWKRELMCTRLGFLGLRHGIKVIRGIIRLRSMFTNRRVINLRN